MDFWVFTEFNCRILTRIPHILTRSTPPKTYTRISLDSLTAHLRIGVADGAILRADTETLGFAGRFSRLDLDWKNEAKKRIEELEQKLMDVAISAFGIAKSQKNRSVKMIC